MKRLLLLLLLVPGLAWGQTAETAAPARPAARTHTPWYISLHASEVGYDLDRSLRALKAAKDLGVDGVRFDIHWFDVEPTRGKWDEAKLTFFTSLVSQARHVGLDPLVIFAGEPGWASALYKKSRAAFWSEYEDYVSQVLGWVADRVDRYQLWNEVNHPIWRFVSADDDWLFFERGGRLVKTLDAGATTVINVLADMPGWERALTRWLKHGGRHVDVVGVDHYPGTWSWRSPTDWQPLKTLLRRARTKGDVLHGKRVAVVETGCSTWPQRIVGDEGQRKWIERALPALQAIVRDANARDPGRVDMLGYYQLIDAKGQPGQEKGFGVLRADFAPKPGAAALTKVLRRR